VGVFVILSISRSDVSVGLKGMIGFLIGIGGAFGGRVMDDVGVHWECGDGVLEVVLRDCQVDDLLAWFGVPTVVIVGWE